MAAKRNRGGKADSPTINMIIRKEEIIEAGHHGGAWKVAYADFVTAMMAFFLLMWLINATTEAQRVGLADYFSQANVLNRGASGEGKPFGGRTPFDHGALSSDRGAVRVIIGNNPVTTARTTVSSKASGPKTASGKAQAIAAPASRAASGSTQAQKPAATPASPAGTLAEGNIGSHEFHVAAGAIRHAIDSDPTLATLKHQISITQTPQGLEIQIMDADKRPMFALGSAAPNPQTGDLIAKITPILARLRDRIRISGYTDARPYLDKAHSNWTLSVDRANATRHLIEQNGFPPGLIAEVAGYADHDLLVPAKPLAASNRRIAILVLRPSPIGGKTP